VSQSDWLRIIVKGAPPRGLVWLNKPKLAPDGRLRPGRLVPS
jgi:hypothetical protein